MRSPDSVAPPSAVGTASGPPAAERVRWAPAVVIVAVIIALLLAPIVLMVVAPARDADSVGVYDRETLRTTDDDRVVLAGFIAPEGWMRVGDREGIERSYRNATGTASVAVTLHMDVGDMTTLLRTAAPVGASFTPVQPIETGAGVTASLIEFDLQAGGHSSQRIVACSERKPTDCLAFDVEVDSGDGQDSALADVQAMVRSVEVW